MRPLDKLNRFAGLHGYTTRVHRKTTYKWIKGSGPRAPWPDFRALTGDPSDSIRGVYGVGPRTAAALLAGGLHLDDLPDSRRLRGTRGERITRSWDQVLLWRDLIRLDTQVPVTPGLLTGQPTPELPRAAALLEALRLW